MTNNIDQYGRVDRYSFQIPLGIGGENLFIFNSDTSNDLAKWKLAEFIISPDFQIEWAIETGYLPINIEVFGEDIYRQYLDDNQLF